MVRVRYLILQHHRTGWSSGHILYLPFSSLRWQECYCWLLFRHTVWLSNVVPAKIVRRPSGDPPHYRSKGLRGSPDDFRPPETPRTIAAKARGGSPNNFRRDIIAEPHGNFLLVRTSSHPQEQFQTLIFPHRLLKLYLFHCYLLIWWRPMIILPQVQPYLGKCNLGFQFDLMSFWQGFLISPWWRLDWYL